MTYHGKMIAGGKVVIPADLRRELNFADGEALVFERDGNSVVLRSRAEAFREMQANIRKQLKEPFSVDDFIAEKRAEAVRE